MINMADFNMATYQFSNTELQDIKCALITTKIDNPRNEKMCKHADNYINKINQILAARNSRG